jgi:uncharacterized protein (TIGR03118 family)
MTSIRPCALGAVAAATAALLAAPAFAVDFTATGLVTDDPSLNAGQITDGGLLNGWGISYTPTGPFWVSSNGAGTSTVYTVNPTTNVTSKNGLTVTIPGDGSVTGQVYNAGGAGNFNGNLFLFVSEDGTISGWRGSLGTTAEVLQLGSSSNAYKGSAFANIAGNGYLYATNFSTNNIDVLKGNAGAPDLAAHFVDPGLPADYSPFNIQNLNNSLYVTYAAHMPGEDDETAGAGLGLVDQFDLQGNFIGRVATGGTLNAPWGLAIAPGSFGAMAGDLLVGIFGDGRISAFDPTTHAFLGQVTGAGGTPLSIDGLWAITVGNGGAAGSTSMLYFSAGPGDEAHGLFGVLTPVPEPATLGLMLAGLATLGFSRRRRSLN